MPDNTLYASVTTPINSSTDYIYFNLADNYNATSKAVSTKCKQKTAVPK